MATTEHFFTGNASTTSFGFTFPILQNSDLKVELDGVLKTENTSGTNNDYSIVSTNVVMNSAPGSGVDIHIYRQTDVDTPKAVFAAGSSIRAGDLNNIVDQALYASQEQQQKVRTADVRDHSVTSVKIKDGAILNADINASADIDNSKIADGLLKSGITVNSANIVNGSIVNDDVSNSANISGSKLADDSVTLAKLGGGTLPTDIVVTSTNIEDGTIVNADINSSAAIAGTKVTPDFGSQNLVTTGTAGTGNLTVGGTISVSGTVDGRDVAADGTKLDTVETNATADQTNEEIRDAVEAASNSNTFTDADHTKLNAIEDSATQDQTAAEIKTLFQSDKLTDSEITTGTLDNRYYTETELDAGQLDNRYFTETELLTDGALDSRYYTETEAEAKFLRQDSSETIASGTTWSNSDAFVATTAAINARIIDLIDEVGGFTAIANQTSFPTTNPQGATGQAAILSIAATTATLTPSGTTVTIPNGAGTGNTVTITGVPTAIPVGFGFLVESTSTTHTYSFHRLVPIATQVNTVAQNITNIVQAGINVADINNFADIYIISSSQPTQRNDGTSLQEGDLWFDTSNDNLQVYTGSAFSIITPSQAVLDDVAIVSGAITYSEDLGLITDPASTGSSNGSLDIVADALEDEIEFTVTVSGGKFLIDGVQAPALTLYKGWTYTFDVSDASNANHPLRFYANSSQYSTGVTVTGTQGSSGAKVQLVVPESQPNNFQYYCTNHSGMGNTITVKDDPIKTVSDNVVKIVAAADNNTNITAVANNASNINSVHANASNINAAVSNASNINAAVSNASDISAVAGNNTNITAVANNATNINAVQANATNINAVNANKTNIDAVAANNSNVTAVANNQSNINSAVANASNINAAVANASNINSAVSNATNINITANNISDVNNFATRYRIGSTNPTTSLDIGDLFFNTSANELRIYNGTQWQGGVTATGNLSQVSGSVFTGDNRYNDNVKAKFGNDSDLQILHTGLNSIINASGTGNLFLQDSGNTKLEVTSTGATITGLMSATTIDGSAGDNLTLDFGTL